MFFAFGGATTALWVEFWFRDRRKAQEARARFAISCTAKFTFSESDDGTLSVKLSDSSDNVAYYLWYLNNGGTMRNEAVIVFVEFDRSISAPQVFTHSAGVGEWKESATTDRFTFVELKGWPKGEVIVQAVDSKSLGLDRRFELGVWRPYSPVI
jgi:hypothetical protein